MSYIEQNLSSGETVMYQTRLHWVVMIAPCIAAVVAGAVGIGLLIAAVPTISEQGSNSGTLVAFGVGSLVVAAVVMAVAFWRRSKTEMAVTNRRVLVKVGILSRRSVEIMLAKIESISVEQSLAGRILGFGTIVVREPGARPSHLRRLPTRWSSVFGCRSRSISCRRAAARPRGSLIIERLLKTENLIVTPVVLNLRLLMTGKEWDSAAYNRLSDPQRAWGMKVLARLRLTGDETVMNAGCGTGRLTAELLEALPRGRVVAVDLSENMLEKAQENLVRYGERVAYVHADLGHLPFEAEFDVILSTAAFHWVKDHEALFRGLFRALKPGGWLEAQCGGGPNLDKVLKRADAVMQSAKFAPFFMSASAWETFEFATVETTVCRMQQAGFDGAEAWLEPAAFRLETPEKFREFAATAIFHPHLGMIPQPDLREEFLNRIVEGSDLELDYWRLNLRGSKPRD